jgi:hypothetical protein
MTETHEGLWALRGKLNHLGLEKAPSKSTASDGLKNRDNQVFKSLYFNLVYKYKSFLSDSPKFGLTFKQALLIDSTTIRLFRDILKEVGFNPKSDGKKRGGLKAQVVKPHG